MDAIQVNGLTVTRGDKTIFRDLSFSVEEGTLAVLSGPSGCGKSTVLLAVQGLLEEEGTEVSGEILVGGKPVKLQDHQDGDPALSGFLMQNVDAQIINLIAGDELVFTMENLGMSRAVMKERSEHYAEMLDIDRDKPVLSMSGGQKQRLLIGSCLCSGHRVLLLDEPFANLDKDGVAKLSQILRNLCDEGVTVLCVEHRLEVVSQFADTLFWMGNGQLTGYFDKASIRRFAAKKEETLDILLPWNMENGTPVVELQQLTARRGKYEVFTGLDLTLEQGATKILVGPNGCGKTTLLRVLCGLSPYSEFRSRSFRFLEKNCTSPVRYRGLRKRTGFVFQNPVHQLFMKTVEEEITLRNPDSTEVEEILQIFHIEHLKNRHPYSLSTGEKRLVSVAAAAASCPPLLLLDEPTIGQDYRSLRNMALSLHELQKRRGGALLLSSHDEQAIRLFGGVSINISSKGEKS